MYDPGRCNMCHRECHHRTLKRICGGVVAAHLVSITVPCVNIRTQGQPDDFIHSLLANPSDTIGAVKAKFLSVIGCQSQSHLLDFHFAGRELGDDHVSLAFYGIMPNDTIDMTFGMKIFVRAITGQNLVICAEPSDSINCIKMKIWFKTGFPPQEIRLVFAGRLLEDGRTLADYNIGEKSTLMLLRRLGG
jgi:ubiquitin C